MDEYFTELIDKYDNIVESVKEGVYDLYQRGEGSSSDGEMEKYVKGVIEGLEKEANELDTKFKNEEDEKMREVHKQLRDRCRLASDDVRTDYGGKAKYAEATKAFKEERERLWH